MPCLIATAQEPANEGVTEGVTAGNYRIKQSLEFGWRAANLGAHT